MKLNRTTSPIKQIEGTSRFGLNIISHPEHLGSVTNEPGNSFCVQLPNNINGSIPLGGTREVIFTTDNRISLMDYSQCTITTLEQNDDFNFTEEYAITGSFRVKSGCESIIYWADHNNPDRFYNISRPEKHQTGGVFDITKTLFNAQVIHPTITTQILNSGGQVAYGTYNFAIEALTANEDVIFTSQVDINYTPVIYQQIEGALNIATNLPEVGGKPLSNKSIKLTITDIPEDTTLIRIIVFRHITSDGLTSDAHVIGELIPNTGNTLEYVYRGFNVDNGDYLVDKNQYLVSKTIYNASLDNIQVESRLLKYNLKEANRNYSEYQSYVSKIRAKYVVKEVDKSDPNVYLLNRTFLGGEIILPCINWVHRDGSVSNSYPLIGRAKLPNDEVLVDDILNNGQQVEKWKYFDTSIKDATPIDGYVSSGEFGYYESSQLYSNPPNYCESNYWGFDYESNNILESPVRLFVVPDRSVEPHDVDDTIRPIGIWFDETTIEFPNDDVVGYYFSVVVVNQSNIEAKGVAFSVDPQLAIDPNNTATAFPPTYYAFDLGSQDGYYNFMSTNYLLGQSKPNGEYMTLEGNWNIDFEDFSKSYNNIFEDDLPYSDLDIYYGQVNASTYSTDPNENEVINLDISIQPSSAIVDKNQVYKNLSNTNSYHIIQLDSEYSTHNIVNYVAVKNSINPISNIWSIVSRRITDLNETVSFRGNNFISPLNIDNIGTIYGDANFFFWQGGEINARTETIKGFMAESTYNSYLRHLGTDSCSSHAQNTSALEAFYIQKITEPYKDKLKVKDSICPFFSGYNDDYSYVQDLNKYRNLGFTFDYCSSCLNVFPNRIIFSPQSFEEDLSDNYRINKANDYIDIPAHTGAITKIDYKDGKLWIRTERATWLLTPNPQQLELSETTVQIGTGDFLSIPARELNVTTTGYGGQQHKLNSINCERGLIWTDNNRKEIYWSHGEFTEIHKDLEQWFNENISPNQFRFGYDPLHDRILMTHKDKWTLSFCFKVQGWKSWHSYIPDWYFYDKNTMYSIYNNSVWKHGFSNNFHQFYGFNFPSIVEFILTNEGQTFMPQSVQYHANVEVNENGYFHDIIDVTYDQMLCYNERQSTGIQNLVLDQMNNIYHVGNQTHVKRVNRNWKISPIKDLAVGPEIWTTDITSIKQGDNQGWMDLLPQVDYNKRQVEIGNFVSKYLAVRLYFNDTTKQATLEFLDSLKLNTIR